MAELFGCIETKISEAGISGVVEDLVAWPDFHSKIISSGSFRRLLMDFAYATVFISLMDSVYFDVSHVLGYLIDPHKSIMCVFFFFYIIYICTEM